MSMPLPASVDPATASTTTATTTTTAAPPATPAPHPDTVTAAGPMPGSQPTPPAGPATPTAPKRHRLRALDGLRLVAALMVACYHYAGQDGLVSKAWGASPKEIFPSLAGPFSYGCLGVELFFVISGFVICMSGWGRSVKDFAISRIIRLYPAYWAALIISTVVYMLAGYQRIPNTDLLVNFSMLQMPLGANRVLGVCWTLWAEMRFYILFAIFVVWPGATRKRVLMFCGLWMLAAAYADASNESFLKVALMPEYASFFIGGVGLYLVHRFGHDLVSWGVVVLGFLFGQRYAVMANVVPHSAHVFHHRTPLGVTLVCAFAFVSVAVVTLVPWVARLNWRWLTTAGVLTYPFYLIHEHVGWVTIDQFHHRTGLPNAVVLVATIATMLLAAWVIHLVIERPGAPRLKKALNRSFTAATKG